jgi:hypothetical protein
MESKLNSRYLRKIDCVIRLECKIIRLRAKDQYIYHGQHFIYHGARICPGIVSYMYLFEFTNKRKKPTLIYLRQNDVSNFDNVSWIKNAKDNDPYIEVRKMADHFLGRDLPELKLKNLDVSKWMNIHVNEDEFVNEALELLL